jgi:hypothetical protein
MQGDGNLVIYDSGRNPVWASDGNRLVAQDDGNVVIYDPADNPIWATNTSGQAFAPTGPVAQGDSMQPGEVLNPDQSISSASGRFTFVYQGDGNLVLYKNYRYQPRKPIWAMAVLRRSLR